MLAPWNDKLFDKRLKTRTWNPLERDNNRKKLQKEMIRNFTLASVNKITTETEKPR